MSTIVWHPSPPATPPGPGFTAWRRERGKRWGRVGTFPTERDAWEAVFRAVQASEPGHYDSCVTREGERP